MIDLLHAMLVSLCIVAAGGGERARPDGSFLSVSISGEIRDRSGTRDTVVGDISHHTLSGESGDAHLSITATRLPGFVTAVTTDNMLYRKARGELLENFGGTQTMWRACTHAGHECRKLAYETNDGRHGIARLYLERDTLVVVNATYADDHDAAQRFLASAR